MQDVQTSMRFTEPSTTARTRWMLGLKRRLVRDFTWRRSAFFPSRLMSLPKLGCLPHRRQTAPMT
jgi:hypothetical protein